MDARIFTQVIEYSPCGVAFFRIQWATNEKVADFFLVNANHEFADFLGMNILTLLGQSLHHSPSLQALGNWLEHLQLATQKRACIEFKTISNLNQDAFSVQLFPMDSEYLMVQLINHTAFDKQFADLVNQTESYAIV